MGLMKNSAMLSHPGADDLKLLNISSSSLSVVGLRNIDFWFGWGNGAIVRHGDVPLDSAQY